MGVLVSRVWVMVWVMVWVSWCHEEKHSGKNTGNSTMTVRGKRTSRKMAGVHFSTLNLPVFFNSPQHEGEKLVLGDDVKGNGTKGPGLAACL